jgi:hypothetical protein
MGPRNKKEGEMKKKLAFALATLLAVGVVATTASATGPVAELDGFACGILDADGNIVASSSSHVTWFASGKVYLRCEGTVANDTGTRITYNFANTGLLCNTIFAGATQNWTNTIGYNGSSQLTCIGHANPNAASAAAGSAGGLG